jgi:hypothetical protein
MVNAGMVGNSIIAKSKEKYIHILRDQQSGVCVAQTVDGLILQGVKLILDSLDL